MYRRPMIPAGFTVPLGMETPEFILRPLTIHDVIRDFDAVMTSAAHLRGLMEPDSAWPEGLTLEENLIDLAWHQREFTARHSFAYTVVTPDGAVCLGCCYINPPADPGYDADAFWWARQSLLAAGLELRLGSTFKAWLARDWPFTRIAFPGRSLT